MIKPKVIEAHIGESKTFTCDKLSSFLVSGIPFFFLIIKTNYREMPLKKVEV